MDKLKKEINNTVGRTKMVRAAKQKCMWHKTKEELDHKNGKLYNNRPIRSY